VLRARIFVKQDWDAMGLAGVARTSLTALMAQRGS
jgi:hypothetical protein